MDDAFPPLGQRPAVKGRGAAARAPAWGKGSGTKLVWGGGAAASLAARGAGAGASAPATTAGATPAATAAGTAPAAAPARAFTVRATKKGGIPVAVETRSCGKKVVVVRRAEGDLPALCTALKRVLGTGGVVRWADAQGRAAAERTGRGSVEVGGEAHLAKVQEYLAKSGCLVGVQKTIKANLLGGSGKQGGGGKKQKAAAAAAAAAAAKASKGKKPPVDITRPLDAKAIKAMKPPALRAHLVARGLSAQGSKKELIARLKGAT